MLTIRKMFTAPLMDRPDRFERIDSNHSLTVPDCIVRIGDLLKAYNGRVEDMQKEMFNGLVFESAGKRYWHDQLNPTEVERINKMMADEQAKKDAAAKDAQLFSDFKAAIASGKYKPDDVVVDSSVSPE